MISAERLAELRAHADRALRAAAEASGPRFGGLISTGWQATVIELLDEVDRLTRELAAMEAVRVAAQAVSDYREHYVVPDGTFWERLDRLTFALTPVPDEPTHSHDGVRLDKVIHPRGADG